MSELCAQSSLSRNRVNSEVQTAERKRRSVEERRIKKIAAKIMKRKNIEL